MWNTDCDPPPPIHVIITIHSMITKKKKTKNLFSTNNIDRTIHERIKIACLFEVGCQKAINADHLYICFLVINWINPDRQRQTNRKSETDTNIHTISIVAQDNIIVIQRTTTVYSNGSRSTNRRRAPIVQSYSPGGANMYPGQYTVLAMGPVASNCPKRHVGRFGRFFRAHGRDRHRQTD